MKLLLLQSKKSPAPLHNQNVKQKSTLPDNLWLCNVCNLFREVDKLPADVLARHLDGGKYHVGDQTALWAAGFTADAARIEGEILAVQNKIEEDKL